MNAETINKIDWSKIIMAICVGILFILQNLHSMKLDEVKDIVVPRHEYTQTADKIMPRDEILTMLKSLNRRLIELEKK